MTHFKTENGASVQFCSQSNLVILPSSLTLMMLRRRAWTGLYNGFQGWGGGCLLMEKYPFNTHACCWNQQKAI